MPYRQTPLAIILACSSVSAGEPPVEAPVEPLATPLEAATLLAGPDIEHEPTPPGAQGAFSNAMDRPREMERPIPLRTYMDEIRRLRREDADPSVAVTDERFREIQSLVREHRRAVEAHMRSFDEDLKRLRNDAAWGSENDPDARPSPDEIRVRDAARQRLRAMRSSGPQDSTLLESVWGALTDAQRDRLEQRFETLRRERELTSAMRQTKNDLERREKAMAKRRAARKKASEAKSGAGGGARRVTNGGPDAAPGDEAPTSEEAP